MIKQAGRCSRQRRSSWLDQVPTGPAAGADAAPDELSEVLDHEPSGVLPERRRTRPTAPLSVFRLDGPRATSPSSCRRTTGRGQARRALGESWRPAGTCGAGTVASSNGRGARRRPLSSSCSGPGARDGMTGRPDRSVDRRVPADGGRLVLSRLDRLPPGDGGRGQLRAPTCASASQRGTAVRRLLRRRSITAHVQVRGRADRRRREGSRTLQHQVPHPTSRGTARDAAGRPREPRRQLPHPPGQDHRPKRATRATIRRRRSWCRTPSSTEQAAGR